MEGCDVVSNSSASANWIRFPGMISADARTPFENGLILLTFVQQCQPKAAGDGNKEALC
jgi:hypothetical protein